MTERKIISPILQCLLCSAIVLISLQANAQQSLIDSLGLKPPTIHNCTEIKDQARSSTCWSFSSNSFIESELMKKGKGKQDLSEMFVARHSLMRKIKTHLALEGKNFFTPGGQFHDVIWVMKNHGMVPEEVYNGRPDGAARHNHAELDTLISHFIDSMLVLKKNRLVKNDEAYINGILDQYLGKVPASFNYKGKNYTPQSFLKQYLQLNPDDFIEITSYTHHPFYTKFLLEDKFNWSGDAYYNVPLPVFTAITDHALQKGYTVGWDGDVTEKGFDFSNSTATLDYDIKDFQEERQRTFEDKSTWIDHMMHIVARVTDKNGNPWYYVKNSWGSHFNELKGFMFMSDAYFKIKTSAIIVNKNALDAVTRKKLGL